MSGDRPALDRRTVLKALGVAGVGASGSEAVGASGTGASSGTETVTGASGTGGCGGYGVAECDDLGGWVFGHKNYARRDLGDDVGTLHAKTFHRLDYLNVEWERFGNPRRYDDRPGCWRHTFLLSSIGMSAFEEAPSYGGRQPVPRAIFTGSSFEVTTKSRDESLALSARRDGNLSGFLDPDALLDFDREPSFDILDAVTEPPDFFSMAENGRPLRKVGLEAGSTKEENGVGWGPVKTAILSGMEHISDKKILNVIGENLGDIDDVLKLAGLVHDWYEIDVDEDDVTPANLGFGHEHEYDGLSQVFGHYVLFDVYAAPGRSGTIVVNSGCDFDSDFTPSLDPEKPFSAPAGLPPFRIPVQLEIHIPLLFASLRDEPGAPSKRFRASVLGPTRNASDTNVGKGAYEVVDTGVPVEKKVIEKGDPTAEFTIEPSPAGVGESVTFDGGASFDPEPAPYGEIISYDWRIKPADADWDSSAVVYMDGVEVERTFDEAGRYAVRLRVADREGLETSVTREFDVTTPPTARIDVHPSSPVAGEDATLYGGGSSDPDDGGRLGAISKYEWSIVQEETGEEKNRNGEVVESFVFPEPGEYRVTLTVTDGAGATGSETVSVTVVEEPLEVSISGPDDVTIGDVETYTAEVRNVVGSVAYDWDVKVLDADGAVVEPKPDADGDTAEIGFFGTASNASYLVTVVATDDEKQADATKEVVATDHGGDDDEPDPLSVSITGDSYACPDSDASLNADVDGGEGPFEYTWSGDVGFSSGSRAAIPYHPSVATRSATVTVEDDSGQTASASTTVDMFDVCPEP